MKMRWFELARSGRFVRRAFLSGALLGLVLTTGARNAEPGLARPEIAGLGMAPLYFEANHGQAEAAYPFIARGPDCSVLLGPTEAVLVLARRPESPQSAPLDRLRSSRSQPAEVRSIRFQLAGANPQAEMSGLEPLPGRANYFIGSDASAWRTGVPLFARVQAGEIYPGIGLVYYCNGRQLEYDFLLQPHARPEQITLRLAGADRVQVNAAGELVLTVGRDEVRQQRPVIYQVLGGVRRPVEGGYRLTGRDTVGFRVADYDRSRPLVIDPTLEFSTYLGGKKLDVGWGVAFDGAGNIYVAGETLSKDLRTTNAFRPQYLGGTHSFGDAFVARYNAVTNGLTNAVTYQLGYLTYFGGRAEDCAAGLAVDTAGYVYLTGFTDSTDFPLTNWFRWSLTGTNLNAKRLYPVDAFVTKLSTNGSALMYSTLLGGSRRDQGFAIAVDTNGCAYVTGYTESTNFLVTAAVPIVQTNNRGRLDAFVAKLGPAGSNLIYSTYLGGTNFDYGFSIAVDSLDQPIVTGYTTSSNFPTVNALVIPGGFYSNYFGTNLNSQRTRSTTADAFVCKLQADGAGFVFSSYLGGSNTDAGLAITMDTNDYAYVTGYTYSKNFPTNWIALPQSDGTNYSSHVFVTKIGPGGAGDVPYSVAFGSSKDAQGTGIAVDTNGNACVTGFCTWTDFFAANSPPDFVVADLRSPNAIAKESKSHFRGFVTVLGGAETNFVHAIYLGGSGSDRPNAIAIRPFGTNIAIAITGHTDSKDFYITNATQPFLGGGTKSKSGTDAFVELFHVAQP